MFHIIQKGGPECFVSSCHDSLFTPTCVVQSSSPVCTTFPVPFRLCLIIGSPHLECLPAQPMIGPPPRTFASNTPPRPVEQSAPSSLSSTFNSWLHLGQSSICLHHGLLVLYLQLVPPPLRLRWAIPSLWLRPWSSVALPLPQSPLPRTPVALALPGPLVPASLVSHLPGSSGQPPMAPHGSSHLCFRSGPASCPFFWGFTLVAPAFSSLALPVLVAYPLLTSRALLHPPLLDCLILDIDVPFLRVLLCFI